MSVFGGTRKVEPAPYTYIYIYFKWIAMWRSCKSSVDMPSRCIWVQLWSYYPCAEENIGSHKLHNLCTFIICFLGQTDYCLWILLFACLEEDCILILWIFCDLLVRWDIPRDAFFLLQESNGLIAWQVSFFETKAAFSGSSSAAIAPQMMAIASCVSLAQENHWIRELWGVGGIWWAHVHCFSGEG